MTRVVIPKEFSKLAALEGKVQKEGLSFKELDALAETALFLSTEKTREIAQRIFIQAQQKKEELAQKIFKDLSQKQSIFQRIQGFKQILAFLMPEQIEEEMEKLEQAVALIEDPASKARLEDALETIRFQISFPILEELEAGPMRFISEIHRKALEVQKTRSLIPLKELSSRQLMEIQRGANR